MSQFPGVADRDDKPFDRQAAIEQLYRDLDKAKNIAFDKEDDTGRSTPDLQAIPKILELQAKCYGVLSLDGKRGAEGGGTIEVPIDKVERLLKDAKSKLKGKNDAESE